MTNQDHYITSLAKLVIYWWEHFIPSFFEAKKRSKKALKKYRATSSPQIASPAAPSHTATPFFLLTRLGECTFSKINDRSTKLRFIHRPKCFEEVKRAARQNTGRV